ncbi:MAG: phosphate-starvation-inducible E-like protein [Deltaproteobacteria bacterium]|nr:phosphate-starvation-inducible E-like protein [Deltaproteobacteria bacterium]
MGKVLRIFEKIIVWTLLCLMMAAVLVSTIELGFILFQELMKAPLFLLNIEEMLEVFGFFLMVLIGLELLESIKAYLEEDRVHAEVVFLVAIVAMSRKVIIVDHKDIAPEMLYGIAAVIIALASGYFLVRRALHLYSYDKKKQRDKEPYT